MVNSCPLTITVASYLLGLLAAEERAEFGRHLHDCPYCRREIAELAPVTHALATFKAGTRA